MSNTEPLRVLIFYSYLWTNIYSCIDVLEKKNMLIFKCQLNAFLAGFLNVKYMEKMFILRVSKLLYINR